MKDIESRGDVQKLVQTFYERVQKDAILAGAFNEVAKVDWETHLPRMVSFWETVIFRVPGYKGNPLLKHLLLSQKMTITPRHFEHWVEMFQETVDDLFLGERADFAKKSAAQMGNGMVHNLFQGHKFEG